MTYQNKTENPNELVKTHISPHIHNELFLWKSSQLYFFTIVVGIVCDRHFAAGMGLYISVILDCLTAV